MKDSEGERGLWGRIRTQFGNHGIAQGRVLLGLMREGDIRTEHWTWNHKGIIRPRSEEPALPLPV